MAVKKGRSGVMRGASVLAQRRHVSVVKSALIHVSVVKSALIVLVLVRGTASQTQTNLVMAPSLGGGGSSALISTVTVIVSLMMMRLVRR